MDIDGLKIKILYLAKGLTQKEFAAQAGLTRSSVSKMLSRGTAQLSSVVKMAAVLEIEPEELLRKKPDEEK